MSVAARPTIPTPPVFAFPDLPLELFLSFLSFLSLLSLLSFLPFGSLRLRLSELVDLFRWLDAPALGVVPAAPVLALWLLRVDPRLEDFRLPLELLVVPLRDLLTDGDCRYPSRCLADGIGPFFSRRCG